MAAGTLNDTEQQLKLKRGTRANLLLKAATRQGIQAEPAYTTDTKQLFVHDGTTFVPVPTLDMALVHDGEILTYESEVLYYF